MPPTELLQTLHGVRRRARVFTALLGLGVVISAGLGVLLIVMLLDALLHLPSWPRLVFLVAALGFTGYVAWQYLVRPLVSRLTLSDVAGLMERVYPEFDDSLRSSVDFMRPDFPGSDVMKDKVVDRAANVASGVDMNHVIAPRPVLLSLFVSAIVIGAAVLVGFQSPLSWPRLLSPFNGPQWPKRVALSVEQLPQLVTADQRVEVKMTLTKGKASKAYLYYRYRSANGYGPEQRIVMEAKADGHFEAGVLAKADADELSIRVEAGDDQLELAPIQVVPRPQITGLTALVNWPAYTKRPPGALALGESAGTRIVAGSDVEFQVTFNNELKPGDATAAVQSEIEAKLDWKWNQPSGRTHYKFINADKSQALEAIVSTGKVQQDGGQVILPNGASVRDGDRWKAVDGSMTVPFAVKATQKNDLYRGAIAKWPADQTIRFHVKGTDLYNNASPGIEEYKVEVRKDMAPTVAIQAPGDNLRVTNVAAFPMEVVATDDFGLKSMTLAIDRRSEGETDPAKNHFDIPLQGWQQTSGGGEISHYQLGYKWNLEAIAREWAIAKGTMPERVRAWFIFSPPHFRPGDSLEYCIQVADTLEPFDPTHVVASSPKQHVIIISQADLEKEVARDMLGVANEIDKLARSQNSTAVETKDVHQSLEKKGDVDPADRQALSRLADTQSGHGTKAKQLAKQLGDQVDRLEMNKSTNQDLTDMGKEAKQQLNDAAEQPMTQASKSLSNANQPNDPKNSPPQNQKAGEERSGAMADAETAQADAQRQLESAKDKLKSLDLLPNMMKQIQDALARQQKLMGEQQDLSKKTMGQEVKDLKPEDKKALTDLGERQKAEAPKTDELTKALEDAAKGSEKSDPTASKALKQAADQAKQQGVSGKQSGAGDDIKDNKNSTGGSKQRQAELGLLQMLQTLKDADRERLLKMQTKLAELQKQIAEQIRRQAGHNIDNLNIQGGDKTKLVTDDLLTKAERKREDKLGVDEGGLPPLQEQTERNTRGLSKFAEELPKGADIVSSLTKAAGKMSRAIIDLRGRKLPDAYDPSQKDALALLEQAKEKVDAQKDEVDDKLDEADRENLRQQYQKIRDKEARIMEETQRLNGVPHEDGQWPHDEAIKLGKLPTTQGSLADETKKLEEVLVGAGGHVYVYANNEVVNSMKDVKDWLAKPDTGDGTQAEEARIVEQLDIMIKNLATKMKKPSKFDSGTGGGNGTGQPPKPKLPAESELRLLKDLQLAINKGTEKMWGIVKADPAKKDKEKLTKLSGKQHELRGELDRLLQAASQGQIKLPPEPDPKDQLPEEAAGNNPDTDGLINSLLNDKPTDDPTAKTTHLIGHRMSRSGTRLKGLDPGEMTQAIQKKIVENLDDLIQAAQQQQSNSSSSSSSKKPGQQMANQPANASKPGSGKPQPNKGKTPAQNSQMPGGGPGDSDTSKNIAETLEGWAKLTNRDRPPVIEGGGEEVVGKYKKLVADYYRSLATKATENK